MANPWEENWAAPSEPTNELATAAPVAETGPWDDYAAPVAETGPWDDYAAPQQQPTSGIDWLPYPDEPPVAPEPDTFFGDVANTAKGFGERTGDLAGSLVSGTAETLKWTNIGLTRVLPEFLGGKTEEEFQAGIAEMVKRDQEAGGYGQGDTDGVYNWMKDVAKNLKDTDLGYEQSEGWESGKANIKQGNYLAAAGDFIGWGAETFAVSLPDMVAAVTVAPAYIASRTEELSSERAANDGRDIVSLQDIAIGGATAVVVQVLEKFGFDRLKALSTKNSGIIGGIIKGSGAEGLTEMPQETLEYLAAQAGTEKGVTFLEGVERALQGFVGGAVGGGAIGGTTGVLNKFKPNEAESAAVNADNELDVPTPTGTGGPKPLDSSGLPYGDEAAPFEGTGIEQLNASLNSGDIAGVEQARARLEAEGMSVKEINDAQKLFTNEEKAAQKAVADAAKAKKAGVTPELQAAVDAINAKELPAVDPIEAAGVEPVVAPSAEMPVASNPNEIVPDGNVLPEPVESIEAQITLLEDPKSDRQAVLLPPGQETPKYNASKLQRVELPDDSSVLVTRKKAGKAVAAEILAAFESGNEEIKQFVLGKHLNFGSEGKTDQDVATSVVTPEGTLAQSVLGNTPEIQAASAQAAEVLGGSVVETDVAAVEAARLAGTTAKESTFDDVNYTSEVAETKVKELQLNPEDIKKELGIDRINSKAVTKYLGRRKSGMVKPNTDKEFGDRSTDNEASGPLKDIIIRGIAGYDAATKEIVGARTKAATTPISQPQQLQALDALWNEAATLVDALSAKGYDTTKLLEELSNIAVANVSKLARDPNTNEVVGPVSSTELKSATKKIPAFFRGLVDAAKELDADVPNSSRSTAGTTTAEYLAGKKAQVVQGAKKKISKKLGDKQAETDAAKEEGTAEFDHPLIKAAAKKFKLSTDLIRKITGQKGPINVDDLIEAFSSNGQKMGKTQSFMNSGAGDLIILADQIDKLSGSVRGTDTVSYDEGTGAWTGNKDAETDDGSVSNEDLDVSDFNDEYDNDVAVGDETQASIKVDEGTVELEANPDYVDPDLTPAQRKAKAGLDRVQAEKDKVQAAKVAKEIEATSKNTKKAGVDVKVKVRKKRTVVIPKDTNSLNSESIPEGIVDDVSLDDGSIIERFLNKRGIDASRRGVWSSIASVMDAAEPNAPGFVTSPMNIKEVLDRLEEGLHKRDPFKALVKIMKGLGVGDILISVESTGPNVGGNFRFVTDGDGKTRRLITLNKDIINSVDMIRVFMHEMIHAITARNTTLDNAAAQQLDAIRVHVVEHLKKNLIKSQYAQYGLSNVDEFLAELFTNESFQRLLTSIPPSGTIKGTMANALAELVGFIADMLGVARNNTALAEALVIAPKVFAGQAENTSLNWREQKSLRKVSSYDAYKNSEHGAAIRSLQVDYTGGDVTFEENAAIQEVGRHMEDYGLTITEAANKVEDDSPFDPADVLSGVNKFIRRVEDIQKGQDPNGGLNSMVPPSPTDRSGVTGWLKNAAAKPRLLGLQLRDQLETNYKRVFEDTAKDGSNALTNFMRADEKMAAFARRFLSDNEALHDKWRALPTAQSGPLHDNMLGATQSQVDPSQDWNHAANTVAKNSANHKQKKIAHTKLRAEWKALTPAAKEIFNEAKAKYESTFMQIRDQIIDNVFVVYEIQGGAATKKAMKTAQTQEDIDNIPPPLVRRQRPDGSFYLTETPNWSKVRGDLIAYANASNQNGPYFTVSRFGEFAVEYSKKFQSKVYATRKAADEAKANYLAENPGAKVSATKGKKDTGYKFAKEEKGFTLDEDEQTARLRADQLAGEGYEVSAVTKKVDLQMDGGTPAGQILAAASSRLKESPEKDRIMGEIRRAMLTLTPESSIQKRMMKRNNVLGANKDMLRGFANYTQTAGWHLAQLKFGQERQEALNDVIFAGKKIAKAGPAYSDDAITAGMVANELKARADIDHLSNGKDAGKFAEYAGKFGFIWYLANLSYSMVNATQVATLTYPYLMKTHGSVAAVAAIGKAYAQLSPDIGAAVIKSGLGLATLWNRDAGQLNTVIDKLVHKFEGKDNSGVGRALRDLAQIGAIDASFVIEMAETARSGNGGMFGKNVDKFLVMARTLPFFTELLNRSVTAMATYELAVKKGANHTDAVEAARLAIVKTQGDYTMQNRPRYFKSHEALKVATMFKVHPLIIYGFLIDRVKEIKDPAQRKEGIRGLTGMLAISTILAGTGGSLMMEPIRLVAYALGAAFDDEEEDFADVLKRPDHYMRQMVFDATGSKDVATAVTLGLPAAYLNANMQGRIGMQALFFRINEQATFTDTVRATLVDSISGPVFGMGENIGSAFNYHAAGGDLAGTATRMMPKGLKDVVKAYNMSQEGIKGFTGKSLKDKEDVSMGDVLAKSIGLSPMVESDVYAARSYNYSIIRDIKGTRKKVLAMAAQAATPEERLAANKRRVEFNKNVPIDMRDFRIDWNSMRRSQIAFKDAERNTINGVEYNDQTRSLRKRSEIYGRD